jgi:hypothetical protein
VCDALGPEAFSESAKAGGMHEGHEVWIRDIAKILHVTIFLNVFNDLAIAQVTQSGQNGHGAPGA